MFKVFLPRGISCFAALDKFTTLADVSSSLWLTMERNEDQDCKHPAQHCTPLHLVYQACLQVLDYIQQAPQESEKYLSATITKSSKSTGRIDKPTWASFPRYHIHQLEALNTINWFQWADHNVHIPGTSPKTDTPLPFWTHQPLQNYIGGKSFLIPNNSP